MAAVAAVASEGHMSEEYEPEIYGIPIIQFCGIVGFVFLLLVAAVGSGGLPDISLASGSQFLATQPNDGDSFRGSDATYQYSANCQIAWCQGVRIAMHQPQYPNVIFVPIGPTAQETQASLAMTQDMYRRGSLPI